MAHAHLGRSPKVDRPQKFSRFATNALRFGRQSAGGEVVAIEAK
jgi:hypothetical protein